MRERNADAQAPTTPCTARGGIPRVPGLRTVFALLTLAFALLVPAGPAAAQGSVPASQAAHLADLLRSNPVYVSDQMPREVPYSMAPAFAKYAKRTGVPTYVLVLPAQLSSEGSLLAAVHDRLGRDGLYVLVDDMGVAAADAYGVRAPADDASTVTLYELPYDAGPLLKFQRFTEVIAEGSAKAARHADSAQKRYGGEGGSSHEPDNMYIGPTDRDNQSFLTGILLTGVPLLILLLSPYVRRRLRRRAPPTKASKPPIDLGKLPKQAGTASAKSGNSGKSTKEATPRARHPLAARLIEAGCALLAAVAVVFVTLHTFDQKTSSAAPPPTAADMSARVDRVAAGLRHDPLYSDPESPQLLTAAQQSELRHRMAEFKSSTGPVYVTLVPQLSNDESGDQPGIFSAALHKKVGKDGVYIVADPLRGDIGAEDYGLRIESSRLTFDLPDAIRHDNADSEPADFRLGARLDQLMTFLDKMPRTSEPSYSEFGTERAPDPVEDNTLHPLFFRSDFWPGVFVGLLAGALAFGIMVALISMLGGLIALRRRRATAPASATPGAFTAPADPAESYLRRTARSDITALGREFEAAPESLPDAVRTRIWDCLDAATLLVDRDSDRRVDNEAAPAELAAAIALARSGRATLVTGAAADFCCDLNPLHGPATQKHDVRYVERGRRRRRRIPVCEPCRHAAADRRHGPLSALRLTLPGADHGERVAYQEAAGPLPAAQHGIARLLDAVREYAGVQ
ncbi:hypothetical protein AB0M87_12380 [Streptomyces sp. NPDC051320]|uniref:hypothetical protein n=1 Tax=Streptomyces sp. NPDC051320 TaxID=3154644 RepID=UPI0034176C48